MLSRRQLQYALLVAVAILSYHYFKAFITALPVPHIIRDAEFKTDNGQGLWPGMWVHTWGWGYKTTKLSPLDACYLWRVEQHDGVMLLAGQGTEVLVPLSTELVEDISLITEPACELLATCPAEWATLRRTGWGVYLYYYTSIYYDAHLRHRLALNCRRGNAWQQFLLPEKQQYQLEEYSAILPTFLATCAWRLKHPNYAQALGAQHPREFWDWPNVPDVKQLHALGQAAYRTEQGNVTISPNGKLVATGRKAWEFPEAATEESVE